jgi:hypothetical protein
VGSVSLSKASVVGSIEDASRNRAPTGLQLAMASLVVSLASVVVIALPAQVAGASSDVVTTCSGAASTSGSLPYEVANAVSGDTITFAPGLSCPPSSPITVMYGLSIRQNLTITGPGAGVMAVSTAGQGSNFQVQGVAVISGLTIENGMSGNGGGVTINHGTVTLTDDTLSGNNAHLDGGGAIYNSGGVLNITDSTLSNNSATEASPGGAIFNAGTMTITNSTLSGNSAPTDPGGAIYNEYTATLIDDTLSGNSARADEGGGGIFNDATLNMGSTILASNTAGDCWNYNLVNNGGVFNDEGYNIADDATCGFTATSSTNTSTTLEASLGSLQNNGGTTDTILPSSTSPAVGVIPKPTTLGSVSVCPRTDERGVVSFGACTIGAVEGGFLITTTSLPSATPGTHYGPVTLTTQESGAGATVKWMKVKLPKGLKLSSAGVLSGTPNRKLMAGPTSVAVKVTEKVGMKKTTVQATIPLIIT